MTTSTGDLDKLINVVDNLSPYALSDSDIAEVKKWGADKVGFILVDI